MRTTKVHDAAVPLLNIGPDIREGETGNCPRGMTTR
jgi:hypothetical protein